MAAPLPRCGDRLRAAAGGTVADVFATMAPGDVIGHNDTAPYNAVWEPTTAGHDLSRVDARGSGWSGGQLVGFIDWDFAAPCPPL